MSLEAISAHHGVPAHLGARVIYTDTSGRELLGVIVGHQAMRLRIKFDDVAFPMVLHPKWCLRYVGAEEPAASVGGGGAWAGGGST